MHMYNWLLAGLLAMSTLAYAAKQTPYAGQQQRQIKALSGSEIDGLLSGKGMGMAKPAELNHYPGPLHVLELADAIALSEEQQLQTRNLYNEMKQEAIRLGKQIVNEERNLDRLFASAKVNDASLKASLDKIARLRGKLRYVHLQTHLCQRAIMSAEQIRHYDRLRGYMNHDGHHLH